MSEGASEKVSEWRGAEWSGVEWSEWSGVSGRVGEWVSG